MAVAFCFEQGPDATAAAGVLMAGDGKIIGTGSYPEGGRPYFLSVLSTK
jgi:hypothetical protein